MCVRIEKAPRNADHRGSQCRQCDGDAVLSMVVVHAAYLKRGIGTKPMRWARDLAQANDITMCTSAAPMSAPIFYGLGFRYITR